MVSAERVIAYGQLETESSLETDPSVQPGPDWPVKGHIELSNLCYRHSNEGPLVLKGITCDIKPGEKVRAIMIGVDSSVPSGWYCRSYWSW